MNKYIKQLNSTDVVDLRKQLLDQYVEEFRDMQLFMLTYSEFYTRNE